MKQVVAQVVSNEPILEALERAGAGTFQRPEARNTLGSWLIWLSCPEIAREAKPGQFVMVRCGGECILPRPFSIHQVNDDDIILLFSVWADGKGTKWLSQCQKGDTLELFGPLGNGFSINPTSKKLLLVAGGIGIAPLSFLAKQALNHGYEINLLMGAGSAVYLLPTELSAQGLPSWAILPLGISIMKVTEDGTAGEKGKVTDLIPKYVDWADQVFVCGPTPMYHDMARRKQELKLEGKPVQVSLEVRMGCGRGLCYGCTIKTKRGLKKVCADGPVFELDDILWDELNHF